MIKKPTKQQLLDAIRENEAKADDVKNPDYIRNNSAMAVILLNLKLKELYGDI